MTAAQRLYYDHVRRGADYVCDQRLCRDVLARHARRLFRLSETRK